MSTIDDEHRIQPFMDSWYAERGLSIDRSGSCRQYDCVLKNGSRSFSVEEKFNFQGHEYDQMIVELIQALEAGELGWFYGVNCDRLVWAYCPCSRLEPPFAIYTLNWHRFKPYVLNLLNESGWQSFNIVTEGYGITLNYPVKWRPLLESQIAQRFDYTLNKERGHD